MRLLSPALFASRAWLVVSSAVLGIALGAALVALLPALRRARAPSALALAAGAAGLALPHLARFAGEAAPGLLVAAAVPAWTAAGAALAALFARAPERGPALYRADLLGAAAGAAAALALAPLLGAPAAARVAAVVLGLAALPLAPAPARGRAGGDRAADPDGSRRGERVPAAGRAVPPAVAVAVAALAALALVPSPLPLGSIHPNKPARVRLEGGATLEATRWGATARVDLLRDPGGAAYLYLDGGAGSLVPPADDASVWARDAAAFAFAAPERQERALLIGPGGGLDVALARRARYDDVTAVEIEREAVELVRGLEGETGPLYAPPVRTVIGEGRAELARLRGGWDVILLSHVVTQAAEARALALSENLLYTEEAFREFTDALAPGGVLAIKLYDEPTLTRALLTAVRALAPRDGGEAAALARVLAVADLRGERPTPLLLVADRPLERERAVALAREAEARGLALLHVPGLLSPPPLAAVAEGGASVAEVDAASPGVDLSPTTDARPFFFHLTTGLPAPLPGFLRALLPACAAALLLCLRPGRGPAARARRALPLAFLALGAAFLLVELAALQRARSLVGSPSVALATTLAALLAGGGVGARLGARLGGDRPPGRIAAVAAIAAAAAVLAWRAALPALEVALAPLPLAARALGAALPLALLGLPMGVPFPQLLRVAGRVSPREVALGWALNGLASVAAGAGATAIAVLAGWDAALAAGAGTYVLAAVAAVAAGSGASPPPARPR